MVRPIGRIASQAIFAPRAEVAVLRDNEAFTPPGVGYYNWSRLTLEEWLNRPSRNSPQL